MKRFFLAVGVVAALAVLASVLVSYGGAQGSPQDPTVIQVQSTGTTVYTGQGFVRENYTGSGCTPSNVSGVLTINCGSSSGTVTSVGLAGTANQITVTGATPITTSGSWTLSLPAQVNLGTNGTAAGVLGLNGLTSGTATFTPPAVAGTSTNAISISNILLGPSVSGISTPQYQPASSGAGFGENSANADLYANAKSGGGFDVAVAGSIFWRFLNGGNFAFNSGKGQHFNTQAANNDTYGTCTTASGTTCAITFTTNYAATPSCTVTPTSNAGAFFLSAQGVSGFTITYATTGAQTFNYHCGGNPN